MPRHRAPHGVVTAKPIALRLMPDELQQLKTLAQTEKRPLANMTRLLVLRAMEQAEQAKAA